MYWITRKEFLKKKTLNSETSNVLVDSDHLFFFFFLAKVRAFAESLRSQLKGAAIDTLVLNAGLALNTADK